MKNTDIIQNIPVTNNKIPASIPRMESEPRFGILAVYNIKTLPANKATIIGINGKVAGVICAMQSYLLNKTVKMTRDIRKPKPSEEVFGKTVWGIELSKEAVTDLIKDTVLESLKKCQVDKDENLDFVVRSTGVTAGFATAEEAGQLIIALADGCLEADIPPPSKIGRASCRERV